MNIFDDHTIISFIQAINTNVGQNSWRQRCPSEVFEISTWRTVIFFILRSHNSMRYVSFEAFDCVHFVRREPANETLEFRCFLSGESFSSETRVTEKDPCIW